jgi:ABC-type transporter MlaC component
MRFRQLFSAAALALSCTFVAGGASADVDAAKAFVKEKHSNIKELVEKGSPSEKVKEAMGGMVDYDQLAKRTMGSPCPPAVPQCTNHWDGDASKDVPALTAEQKKEVTDLLKNLVEKNLQKNLNKTRDFDVSYSGAKDVGENVSKIKTEAKSKVKPRDPAVQVDYVILGTGDKYRVIDIVTEGSSMTKNYYDQFHRMLTTEGQRYPYLVQKLKDKIAAKDKEAKEAAAK